MQDVDFNYISDILKERSGLSLTKDKVYLLESRLQPIARSHNMETVDDLIKKIRTTNDQVLVYEVVQAMTTNETMFFRDNKPFERLKATVLPAIIAANPAPKTIRIWSAACSAGQEPYSLAITMQEALTKHPGYSFEILATDLCDKMVEKAKQGLYSQFEIQRGLPIQMMIKYFTQAPDNHWQISDALKKCVRFDTHNLLNSPATFGKFDFVFCRNVLIYFDEPTKTKVLEHIARATTPPGFLFLGSAENTMGLTNMYKRFAEENGIFTLS